MDAVLRRHFIEMDEEEMVKERVQELKSGQLEKKTVFSWRGTCIPYLLYCVGVPALPLFHPHIWGLRRQMSAANPRHICL